jgi:hypothetical protein
MEYFFPTCLRNRSKEVLTTQKIIELVNIVLVKFVPVVSLLPRIENADRKWQRVTTAFTFSM